MEPDQQLPEPNEFKLGPISQFAIKTVIVGMVGALSVWFVLSEIDDLVDKRVREIKATIESGKSIGGREFWTRFEEELERQADQKNDLSPDKKEKLLAQIRTLSDRWRPLVVEALSVLDASKPAKPSK
jgi:hypothetical protein